MIFEGTEARRVAEVAQLEAGTALEWILEAPQHTLLSESSLRAPGGECVAILECTPDYATKLGSVVRGEGDVGRAIAPLQTVVRRELEAGGCVVARRVPLDASHKSAAAVCAAFGCGVEQHSVVDKRLGNDAPYPGAPLDAVCVAVARPACKATTARLRRVDDVINALSPRSRAALEDDLAFELRGGTPRAAPVIAQDKKRRPTLQFSRELQENVEWAAAATEAVCDALSELDLLCADDTPSLALGLRANDILVIDARRWLYAIRHDELPGSDLRFSRGIWMPAAALPPLERDIAPTEPLLLRGRIPAAPAAAA